MLTKEEQAKADRFMQSIASLSKDESGVLLTWLREKFKQNVFLLEDINGGKNSSVGGVIRKWLKIRHEMPVEQRDISTFSSPGEIVRLMPADQDVMISNRQEMLLDRKKSQFESWSHTFASGMTLTIPLSMFGAVSNSIGTTWCTGAMKDNRFEAYSLNSPLLIMRLPNGKMYQATFELEEGAFSGIVSMNGGENDSLPGDLEEFIEMGLTVKNATDEDLSEDEYEEFMTYFSDVIPMMAKNIVRGLKGEWDRVLNNMSRDRDEERPVLDESTIAEHLRDYVPVRVERSHNTAGMLHNVASRAPDASGEEKKEANVPPGSAGDLLSALDRRSFTDAIIELRSILSRKDDPERVDEVLREFGQKAPRSFLVEIVSGITSSSDFMSRNGSVLALFKALGPDQFGSFMADLWNSHSEHRKIANMVMFMMVDSELAGAYPTFIQEASKDIEDTENLNILDFGANRIEMARAEDISALPQHIQSLPWMDRQNRDAVRLGFLIDCFDHVRNEQSLPLPRILELASEYPIFTDGMRQYPSAVLRALFPNPDKIDERDYVSLVSKMFEIKEQSLEDDNTWSNSYDVIAAALVSRFPDTKFKDKNIRQACLTALCAMDRSATKMAPREHRWLFDAFAFRSLQVDDEAYCDSRIETNNIRRFGLMDFASAAYFLRSNDISEKEIHRIVQTSQLSSMVPHHTQETVGLVEQISEKLSANPASPVLMYEVPEDILEDFKKLQGVGKRQIDSGVESFRDAAKAFMKFHGDGDFEPSYLAAALDSAADNVSNQQRVFHSVTQKIEVAPENNPKDTMLSPVG